MKLRLMVWEKLDDGKEVLYDIREVIANDPAEFYTRKGKFTSTVHNCIMDDALHFRSQGFIVKIEVE